LKKKRYRLLVRIAATARNSPKGVILQAL